MRILNNRITDPDPGSLYIFSLIGIFSRMLFILWCLAVFKCKVTRVTKFIPRKVVFPLPRVTIQIDVLLGQVSRNFAW
jgi:hypothetical protein